MKDHLRERQLAKAIGFTLIEVMLVIAVVGILALVTVPKYQAMTTEYHLQSSADLLAGQLRYAKQLAMDRRQNIAVGLTAHTVQVFQILNPPGQFDPLGQAQTFATGVEFSGASNAWLNQNLAFTYVYFDYRGFTQTNPAGTTAVFTLMAPAGGQRVQVNLEAGTGNVTVSWP
ncbi:fimbrial protein precursor [Peptococcaceae bacterium CEB3]|nr:fimbrial protein precursor [Peptococcaceae bacterium CEB3]